MFNLLTGKLDVHHLARDMQGVRDCPASEKKLLEDFGLKNYCNFLKKNVNFQHKIAKFKLKFMRKKDKKKDKTRNKKDKTTR